MAPGRCPRGARGGSGPIVSRPASILVRHRAFPLLPEHTPNRSDKTGRRTAIEGISSACNRAATKSGSLASLEYPAYFPPQLSERSIENCPIGVEHYIPLRRQSPSFVTNRFSHPPLDPVPRHRLAQRPRHGQTDPGAALSSARQAKSSKIRTGNPYPFPVNPPKVAGSQDSALPGKGKTPCFGVSRFTSRFERLSRR